MHMINRAFDRVVFDISVASTARLVLLMSTIISKTIILYYHLENGSSQAQWILTPEVLARMESTDDQPTLDFEPLAINFNGRLLWEKTPEQKVDFDSVTNCSTGQGTFTEHSPVDVGKVTHHA
ncbi:unnamed protein product [Heligmosomoides polygyrus]|uniref:Neur_chan_LBD domain-containing protein n=1 Tax=Heligmosomoides polygyrus TaxID=6339 RepID=A0A183GHW1_HELPZ|nr:unnamed protein product [Heligmosomoides polygyrus]